MIMRIKQIKNCAIHIIRKWSTLLRISGFIHFLEHSTQGCVSLLVVNRCKPICEIAPLPSIGQCIERFHSHPKVIRGSEAHFSTIISLSLLSSAFRVCLALFYRCCTGKINKLIVESLHSHLLKIVIMMMIFLIGLTGCHPSIGKMPGEVQLVPLSIIRFHHTTIYLPPPVKRVQKIPDANEVNIENGKEKEK